ncbi:ribonuclease H family protein [Selenomonas sp. KH1T6]|uniref:ribonuclease H family protein n=1 Tax=Selenomonas sp. KH1T6 TaxID=3158784 RepID=UPI0008A7C00B|nr:Ribonuclease HI [Selenomonas ruminantium]
MAKSYYAVLYKDGKGKIFTNIKEYKKEIRKNITKLYKGFDERIEAEKWMKNPADFPREKKYYAVKVGRNPGIYTNIEEYDAQMKGYPNCLGKAFYTIEGAKHWLRHVGIQLRPSDKSILDYISVRLRRLINFLFVGIRVRIRLKKIIQKQSEQADSLLFCQINTNNQLIIYTDASIRDNKAGYAAAIIDKETGAEFYLGGSNEKITDSNRGELYALIYALRLIDIHCKASVEIRTDSNYLVQFSKSENLQKMKEVGWQINANADLWKEFYRYTTQRVIQITWVRGHNGEKYNVQCDKIARQCSEPHSKEGIDCEPQCSQ